MAKTGPEIYGELHSAFSFRISNVNDKINILYRKSLFWNSFNLNTDVKPKCLAI